MRVFSLTADFPSGLATRIVGSLGGTTEITYKPAVAALRNDLASGCRLPSGMGFPVVASIAVSDGRTRPPAPETFDYSCARWSWRERGFLGWQERHSSNPSDPARPGSTTLDRFVIGDECLVQPSYSQIHDGS